MLNRNPINISDNALKLLIHINDKGYVEYADPEFESVQDFQNSLSFMTVEEFKKRNSGGTLYLVMELLFYKLVEGDTNRYNVGYKLSNFGRDMTIKIIRKVKLEKLETI